MAVAVLEGVFVENIFCLFPICTQCIEGVEILLFLRVPAVAAKISFALRTSPPPFPSS